MAHHSTAAIMTSTATRTRTTRRNIPMRTRTRTTTTTWLLVSVLLVLLTTAITAHAAECQDDPRFLWKGDPDKTCAWIASRSPKKRERLCRKSGPYRKCKQACDSCNASFTTCPYRKTSRVFQKKCDHYQENLQCSYEPVWTGCNNNSDMACTPSYWYSCETEPSSSRKTWHAIAAGLEECKPTPENKPYGAPCRPDQCPPFAPAVGASCAWYQGTTPTCDYDYQVTGCHAGTTECSPATQFSCDPVSQTWVMAPISYLCGTGTPCDPETYFDCPREEPAPGDLCTNYQGQQDCKYGHEIMGCHPDDLFCGYTSFGSCVHGSWQSYATIPPSCSDGDTTSSSDWLENTPAERGDGDASSMTTTTTQVQPQASRETETEPLGPVGEPCDPRACPPSEPREGSSCLSWEGDRDQECFYQYTVRGCDSNSLNCSPDFKYTCSPDTNVWQKEYLVYPECIAVFEPRWGEPCDPNDLGCPLQPPKDGSDCSAYANTSSEEDTLCHYKYIQVGCSEEDAVCFPSESYSCDPRSKEWQLHPSIQIACEREIELPPERPDRGPVLRRRRALGAEAPPPVSIQVIGTPCNPNDAERDDAVQASTGTCPLLAPSYGASCARSGLSPHQGCPYNYMAMGCSCDSLTCAPVDTFYCDSNGIWQHEVTSVEFCLDAPSDWPDGGCDPRTFDKALYIDDIDNDCDGIIATDDTTIDNDISDLCPAEQPEEGSPCDDWNSNCWYNYFVEGCTPESLRCEPFTLFTCEANTRGEYTWQMDDMPPSQEFCQDLSETWPAGNACDPTTFDPREAIGRPVESGSCPLRKPLAGSDCTHHGLTGEQEECIYDYSVVGCTPETLQCLPDAIYYCDAAEGIWIEEVMMHIQCVPPKGYPTGACHPETFDPVYTEPGDGLCPESQPEAWTDCSETGDIPSGCPYNYIVTGCTLETAACSPIDTFFCWKNGDGEWQWLHMIMRRELDVEYCEDGPPAGSCVGSTFVPDPPKEGVCPDSEPKGGTDCSRTGSISGGCPYNYIVTGCTEETAECSPIDTFYCAQDDRDNWTWQHTVMRRDRELSIEYCPDGPPEGECDGSTFLPISSESIIAT